jgi:hypothetical protein
MTNSAAAAAASALIYLVGVRGFNASGQLTTILTVNSSTGHVKESPLFVVRSPFDGCGAAFDAGGGAAGAPPAYYIPDGSPMEPAPLYEYLTVDMSGAITHRAKAHGGVPAGGSWDFPFVAFDAASRLGYGVGSLRPPPGPEGNTSLVSFDPVSGLQTVVDGSSDLQFFAEEPFCVAGVSPTLGARGSFHAVNGVIQKTEAQQLVTVDVASGRRTGKLEYATGMIMSLAGHASGVFCGLEPDSGGASTLVLVDPLAKAWGAPKALLTLGDGWAFSQGLMGLAGADTLAVFAQRNGEGRSQLIVGDVSVDPPAFAAPVDVDLSCCPWGVGAVGGVVLA